MDEQNIQVFIDGVKNYFLQQTGVAAEVGTPYLSDAQARVAYEYTGIIGISGNSRGCVYYTAPGALLRDVLLRIGESDVTPANQSDLAGEIANTIAGNARREFGKDFMISVPVVVSGGAERISLPPDLRAMVVPILWRKHAAALVVALADKQ